MIRAGKLRHKIEIKSLSNGRDNTGRSTKIYTALFSIRCNVKVLSGSELVKSGVNLSKEYVSIMARGDRRLTHDQFFEYKGNIFSIEAIKPSDNELDIIITGERDI
jgi:SPP1 family predicted phage head-tail adaptor